MIRQILVYGFQIYFYAATYNLEKLKRMQSSTTRITTDMRNSWPMELILYEHNLQSLSLRINTGLARYFNGLYSFGSHYRPSTFLRDWDNNQRVKRDSPFSRLHSAQNLEPNSLPLKRHLGVLISDYFSQHLDSDRLPPHHPASEELVSFPQMTLVGDRTSVSIPKN